MFTQQGKYDKADVTKQNAEYSPTVYTLGDIEPRNTINNIVKNKPWSAHHRQRHSGKLSVYPSAHKDLPFPVTTPLDQVKTAELEFDEAVVEERFTDEHDEATVFGEFYKLMQR